MYLFLVRKSHSSTWCPRRFQHVLDYTKPRLSMYMLIRILESCADHNCDCPIFVKRCSFAHEFADNPCLGQRLTAGMHTTVTDNIEQIAKTNKNQKANTDTSASFQQQ